MTIQYTPRLALPYPQVTDTSNVPRDIGALANQIETLMNQLIPIGALHLWTVAGPPAGWLICDGSALARVGTYAALFAVIGTTYNFGTVDPANFCLPDLRGKMPMGSVSGSPLGTSGGASAVTLDKTQIPSHNHGGATGTGVSGNENQGHNHAATYGIGHVVAVAPGNQAAYIKAAGVAGDTGVNLANSTQNESAAHNHNVPALGISADGGGLSHNNLPPYQVINYIIRYQ